MDTLTFLFFFYFCSRGWRSLHGCYAVFSFSPSPSLPPPSFLPPSFLLSIPPPLSISDMHHSDKEPNTAEAIQRQQADLQAKILSLLGSNAVVPSSSSQPSRSSSYDSSHAVSYPPPGHSYSGYGSGSGGASGSGYSGYSYNYR